MIHNDVLKQTKLKPRRSQLPAQALHFLYCILEPAFLTIYLLKSHATLKFGTQGAGVYITWKDV